MVVGGEGEDEGRGRDWIRFYFISTASLWLRVMLTLTEDITRRVEQYIDYHLTHSRGSLRIFIN